MNSKPHWGIFFIPAALSLLALTDLPYGYYQFLRIVVTCTSTYIGFAYMQANRQALAYIFWAQAVLFNPIAKIHMEKEIHLYFNVTAGLFYLAAWYHFRRISQPATNRD